MKEKGKWVREGGTANTLWCVIRQYSCLPKQNLSREGTCNTAPQNSPLSGGRISNSARPFLSSSHWSESTPWGISLHPFLDCVTWPLQTAPDQSTMATADTVHPEARNSIPPSGWQEQYVGMRLARQFHQGSKATRAKKIQVVHELGFLI